MIGCAVAFFLMISLLVMVASLILDTTESIKERTGFYLQTSAWLAFWMAVFLMALHE